VAAKQQLGEMRIRLGFLGIVLGALGVVAVDTDDLHKQFVSLAANNRGIIPLDADLFDKLTAPDRTWSATVQLTALGKAMKCTPCREFKPQFELAAKSWTKVEPETRNQHLFATLDFDVGRDVFRRLGLASAPVVYMYPAAKGPRRPENGKTEPKDFDFNKYGFDVEALVEQISRTTPVPIPYSPPPNYGAIIMVVLGALSLLLTVRYFTPILTSRWTWAALVIGASIIFPSGIMFVRIRGSPWVSNRNGQQQWMAGGYQSQYGMEVQVISAIYLAAAFSYTALIFLVPRISSPSKQRLGIYIWCTLSVVLLAILLYFLRIKNPAYPFRLFF